MNLSDRLGMNAQYGDGEKAWIRRNNKRGERVLTSAITPVQPDRRW